MPLPARPRPGQRSRHEALHEQMSTDAASSSSQLKAAVFAKRPIVEEKVRRTKNATSDRDERINGASEKHLAQNLRR